MNTASQNLAHHLGVLREKLQHATDYEQALYYFLEEFAGDEAFIQQCEPEEALNVVGALTSVAGKTLGQSSALEQKRILRLPQFGFTHGNAAVSGRVLLFFYFESEDTGLVAFIPGTHGGADVARFRLTGALTGNPKHN
jgi:hypothetical protein